MFQLHNSTSQPVIVGSQAEASVEVMETHCLLACSPWLPHSAFSTRRTVSLGRTLHSERQSPQTCVTGQPSGGIFSITPSSQDPTCRPTRHVTSFTLLYSCAEGQRSSRHTLLTRFCPQPWTQSFTPQSSPQTRTSLFFSWQN